MYALQDCIDFSSYSDTISINKIDVDKLLINKEEMNELIDSVVLLLSRYVIIMVCTHYLSHN